VDLSASTRESTPLPGSPQIQDKHPLLATPAETCPSALLPDPPQAQQMIQAAREAAARSPIGHAVARSASQHRLSIPDGRATNEGCEPGLAFASDRSVLHAEVEEKEAGAGGLVSAHSLRSSREALGVINQSGVLVAAAGTYAAAAGDATAPLPLSSPAGAGAAGAVAAAAEAQWSLKLGGEASGLPPVLRVVEQQQPQQPNEQPSVFDSSNWNDYVLQMKQEAVNRMQEAQGSSFSEAGAPSSLPPATSAELQAAEPAEDDDDEDMEKEEEADADEEEEVGEEEEEEEEEEEGETPEAEVVSLMPRSLPARTKSFSELRYLDCGSASFRSRVSSVPGLSSAPSPPSSPTAADGPAAELALAAAAAAASRPASLSSFAPSCLLGPVSASRLGRAVGDRVVEEAAARGRQQEPEDEEGMQGQQQQEKEEGDERRKQEEEEGALLRRQQQQEEEKEALRRLQQQASQLLSGLSGLLGTLSPPSLAPCASQRGPALAPGAEASGAAAARPDEQAAVPAALHQAEEAAAASVSACLAAAGFSTARTSPAPSQSPPPPVLEFTEPLNALVPNEVITLSPTVQIPYTAPAFFSAPPVNARTACAHSATAPLHRQSPPPVTATVASPPSLPPAATHSFAAPVPRPWTQAQLLGNNNSPAASSSTPHGSTSPLLSTRPTEVDVLGVKSIMNHQHHPDPKPPLSHPHATPAPSTLTACSPATASSKESSSSGSSKAPAASKRPWLPLLDFASVFVAGAAGAILVHAASVSPARSSKYQTRKLEARKSTTRITRLS
jgi:hypothetical protein